MVNWILFFDGVMSGFMLLLGFYLGLVAILIYSPFSILADEKRSISKTVRGWQPEVFYIVCMSWIVFHLMITMAILVAPLILSFLYGLAYWFDLEGNYSCNVSFSYSRVGRGGGTANLSYCPMAPVFFGMLVGIAGTYFLETELYKSKSKASLSLRMVKRFNEIYQLDSEDEKENKSN